MTQVKHFHKWYAQAKLDLGEPSNNDHYHNLWKAFQGGWDARNQHDYEKDDKTNPMVLSERIGIKGIINPYEN